MIASPSMKNIYDFTNKTTLFTDKDKINFEKIMSKRKNSLNLKTELKYVSNDAKKNVFSHSNKNINHVLIIS